MSPSNLTRRSLLAGAAAAPLAALTAPSWATTATRPGAVAAPRLTPWDRQVLHQLRPQNALNHLHHLADVIGQRYAGTPQEKAAADYLAATLDGYGYDVELESIPLGTRRVGELKGNGLDQILCWGVGIAAGGRSAGTVTGSVVVATDVTGSNLPADLTGKIVVRYPTVAESATTLVNSVATRGAVAVIIAARDGVPPRQTSTPTPSYTGPHNTVMVAGIGQVQKYDLQRAMASGLTELSITAYTYENATSQNVHAVRKGRSGSYPNRPEVAVCAHYDSVIGARGANDDGSGTVLTVELARLFRNFPTFADVRFVLWGAEEGGLIGSRQYARSLDAAQRERILGVFNNDMVGTSWSEAEKYWVLTYLGAPNPVNAEVLAAGERLGYASKMSPVTQRGSSDHQSFEEVGVPSGNFSWRGVETPALLEPEYHSSDDTITHNISPERLTVSMEIQACAAYALARSAR